MKKLSCLLLAASTVLPLRALADAVVVFNEIMYHPATTETNFEWVELYNELAVDVDVSEWSISGGINYTFPVGSVIKGRSYAVVAISPAQLAAATGLTGVYGPYTNRLSNNGDVIRLRNNSGRLMDEVSYGVDDSWPIAADGFGVSLAKRDKDSASGPAANWTVSEQIGGTPGVQNFQPANVFVAPPGLVSYWDLNESGTAAIDTVGQNGGTLGAGATRAAGTGVGGAVTFDGTSSAYLNVGPGANNNLAVSNGLTIEALLRTTWSGNGTATIFRKAPARPTNYVGAVQASAPLSYWRLNDTTASIQDSMPGAHTGAATAGVQLNQPGLIASDAANNAIRVSGTDRIVVPGFEKIGAAGYAVEYWVKPNVLPTGCCQNLVGDGESSGDYYMMNYLLGPPQGLVGAVRPHFGPGNSPVSMDSLSALQAGQTYHIVTTWDTSKATDNAVIFINGVANRVGTITRNVPAANTTGANKVYIGKDDRDTSDGDNTIDEVAVYNRPLSAAEVASHYLAGALGNFDQNQGNAIQLALQNDGNNAQANPPVPAGPVLSFGLTVNGTYGELDMPLDGQSGRPTLASLQNGQFHHVAASYNPQTGLKAIYLDGVLVYSTTLSGALNAANPADAVFGNSAANGASPLTGALDELAYWSKALSASEVAAHAAAAQAGRTYFAPAPSTGPVLVAFNEVSSPANSPFFVELINTGTSPIALGTLSLRHDGSTDHTNALPAGNLAPGALVAVTAQNLGFTPVAGDKFYLVETATGRLIDSVVVKNRNRARFAGVSGGWANPSQATPGAANAASFHNEIVINEILYSHMVLPATGPGGLPRPSAEEWLELYNRGASPVDLTGWELGGGISYRFTPGQILPPDGYLVVARDAATLRAAYPGITIVGNYGGGLSDKGDHIVLRDPSANVADEITYFDGGRWPEYADGLGASLELMNPNADNAKAETWAASDESHKTDWQTFTYRMVANIPAGSGQPTQWQDFILGLQSSGECLIDDISVIQAPATAPVQVISNGDFSSGMSGWRVLGTHNRSRVEPDPDNPGNNVLHIVATGPQEHMHNHIERTLNSGRTIVAGAEYEISFRARWLIGNNLLNSRLYFDRSARTVALPVASRNGTPGARNSRWVANVGPTFDSFSHTRPVPAPGEAVTVSVNAEDPDGVAAVRLFYSVDSGAWTSTPMSAGANGTYTGTIPGQAASSVVQFYVSATDTAGAVATYPARGTASGALFKVNDNLANLPLAHNVRLIVTPDNINLLHGNAQGVNQTNVMSNDLVPCTVIYDENRVYYDCGVHLRGSQRGRYSDVRTGFHIEFPPDDKFRGVQPIMLIDRSGAGDATANRQEEIVLKHILNRAGGLQATYPEICHLIAPRPAHGGAAQFFPRHEDVMLESAFNNGTDGVMYEMELIYYPTTANAAGYKNPQPDSVVGTDITNLGDDKEIYRYNFMIKNNREVDDYNRLIALGKAWSLTGAALDSATKQLMDIDEWMRAYALVSLCSVGDMYTFGNNHNFFTYSRPSDGKFVYFPWDMDFSFTRGSSGALVGDQNLAKVVNLPGNLRRLYAHMLDIISVSFNGAYMSYWTAHYASFAPGQSYAGSLSTLIARVPFVTNTINTAGGNTPFNIAGPTTITTNGSLLTLSGTAPVAVQSILVNGREYPITWTSISAWTLRVPIDSGTSTLEITLQDVKGRPLPALTRTLTVVNQATLPLAENSIVINEIMYNPLTPEASFVELYNRADAAFDLSDWRVNGVGYTFPAGTVITNRGYLVLTKNTAAYISVYGATAPLTGQFDGQLDDGGETLTLERPTSVITTNGSTLATNTVYVAVSKVRYDDDAPWPVSADGTGPSLQLVDANQDNSRVANWSDPRVWQQARITGSMGASTNNLKLYLYLDSPGEVLLDDIALVEGTEAEVGENLIRNGDFEQPLSPAWVLSTNNTPSEIVGTTPHSGSGAFRVVSLAAGAASGTRGIIQDVVGAKVNTTYTLSFWFLPSTTASNVIIRTAPGSQLVRVASVRPQFASPGAANSVARTRPAFDPVWLNELQPVNLTGLADGQGEREPWVELYNAGSNPVSLAGYYLSDSYSSLTRWAFPNGASLQPGEFKVVFLDGETGESTASEWHASFRPADGPGSLALTWTPPNSVPEVLDYFNYPALVSGRSYGAYPDGQPFNRQEFYKVTPGTTNDNTAAPIVAYINEWMAANSSTLLNTNNNNHYDDWFELYNPGDNAVSLDGYFLTDNLNNKTQFAIPNGYTIPAKGYLLVWADGAPTANSTNRPELHVSFKLDQGGEAIGLFSADGLPIDTVTFEGQFTDRSQGRVPDGTGPQYFLLLATPGAANTIWANRYPTLAPIADTTAIIGQPFSQPVVAGDPDGNTLAFTGAGSLGGTVDPATGVFTWTPLSGGTNRVTITVADNGAPSLTATRTFVVRAVNGVLISAGSAQVQAGLVSFNVGTVSGRSYRIEYKNSLSDTEWQRLGGDRVASGASLTITDDITSSPQRFYRVAELP